MPALSHCGASAEKPCWRMSRTLGFSEQRFSSHGKTEIHARSIRTPTRGRMWLGTETGCCRLWPFPDVDSLCQRPCFGRWQSRIPVGAGQGEKPLLQAEQGSGLWLWDGVSNVKVSLVAPTEAVGLPGLFLVAWLSKKLEPKSHKRVFALKTGLRRSFKIVF